MLRKLASQTAVYGISAIMSKFLNYLLTPYLTRVLSTSVYGQVSLFYAIIPFANVLLTMGLATAYFRYAARAEDQASKRTLFTTLWAAVSQFALVFFVVAMVWRGSLAELLEFENSWYLVGVATLVLIDNVASIPLASLRERGRAGYYTMVNVSGVVVNVVACWGFYSFVDGARESPIWVLMANIVASGVSLLMLLVPSFKMLSRRVDFSLLKRILVYSLPLMLAGLMGTAGDFIDRIMLSQMLDPTIAKAQVGIYSAVAKIAALMVIFRQIYSLGAEPFFLQKFKNNDFATLNARAMNLFCAVGILIFLFIALFQSEFALIIGGDFRSGMSIVPLLLAANLLSGMLINLSFWYKVADMTRMALYVTVLGIVSAVVLNLILIPEFGYVGSAWARVASTFVMVGASYVLGQKYYRVPYNLRRLGLYFSLGALVYILSLLTSELATLMRLVINGAMLLALMFTYLKIENITWKTLRS